MKNIWIDGYEANVKQRLGSGQVSYEIIKNLEKIDKKNNYTILLPESPLADLPKEREGWRYRVLTPKRLWTRIALPWAIFRAKQKPDLIFTPTHYIPRFTKIKRVVMIFDLAYLHFKSMFKAKDLYQLDKWTRYSIENSSKIITISNSTKKDIIKNYRVNKDNVVVAYPGYGEQLYKPINDQEAIDKIKRKYGIEGRYVLFLGTVQPRKNLLRLIEAMVKIEDVKLVVVGKTVGEGRQAWMFEEILNKPKQLGIEEKIKFTGYVEDADLPYLFNGATAFVLPSLWEGFGIPLVDAMACGVPVISSNVSSLPEVVGKAGLLVDPKSIDQIEQAIRVVVSDFKLRRKLSRLGKERVKKFGWKKMAKEVLKVLESV